MRRSLNAFAYDDDDEKNHPNEHSRADADHIGGGGSDRQASNLKGVQGGYSKVKALRRHRKRSAKVRPKNKVI
jgi:hypothetical protein